MNKDEKLAWLRREANEASILRKTTAGDLGPAIIEISNLIAGVIGAGGKLLLAGNGGSASDASHFAAEMIVRLTASRNRQSLPAIALNVDPCVMTAASNDFGFDKVFARQVEGLGNQGDLLMVISTSGNSENLIQAVQVARSRKLITAALLGNKGGQLASIVDKPLIVPHPSTQRIQEEHIFIIHLLVELVESDLYG